MHVINKFTSYIGLILGQAPPRLVKIAFYLALK